MDIFTIFGQISINHRDALQAISDTSKQAKKLNDQMQHTFEKIGSFAVNCGKVVASGLAVGTAAMTALLKSSIGEYAEYEQLVGGIETLFKDSKDKVMQYANEAYKNQGLSANDYMSTVTSFSASLLQGLGGDTEAAAKMADMAITDMADNANKMGTDMTLIQNAYQGFAKQNYTMLDNLKLGYGGTQAEMARLINDSGVLGSAITVTAETVNQVSFDKIIEAIHIVQGEMDITGTTAKEASETISGSFAAFKSTWTNLMTGLASGDQDIDLLLDNFLNAGETVVDNVVKVLPKIKRNTVRVVEELTQYAGQKIKTGWNKTIWPFIQKQMKLRFGVEVPDWQTVKTMLETGWNSNVKPLLDGFQTSVGQVFDWFSKNGESVTAVIEAIGLVFAGTWLAAHPLITALGLLGGAFVVLNTDTTNASDTLQSIKSFLEDLKTWIDENETVVTAFFGAAAGAIALLKSPLLLIIWLVSVVIANWDNLKRVVDLTVTAINNFFAITLPTWWDDNVVKPVIEWWNKVTTAINNAAVALKSFFSVKGWTSAEAQADFEAKSGGKTFEDWQAQVESGDWYPKASGMYRVPFDGYPALLHKDEAVLNRLDAREWRTANAYGGTNANTGRLESLMGSMIDLMRQMVANTGAGQNLVLDSGVLVGQLAPRIDKQLGTISGRKGRGN